MKMKKIKSEVAKSVMFSLGVDTDPDILSHPSLPCVLSTPIALKLSKALGKNPNDLVQLISAELQKTFDEVEVVGGRINFKPKNKDICDFLRQAIESPNSLGEKVDVKEKILLEYVSANPTGELHLGHARWAAIGSSLASILRFVGHDVVEEFYYNDAGNQIDLFGKSIRAEALDLQSTEDGYKGEYIKHLAGLTKGSLNQNSSLEEFIDFAVNTVKEDQKLWLKKLNVNHQSFVSEKTLHESGFVKETLKDLENKGVVYETDSGKMIKSGLLGDSEDRVIVRPNGVPTYIAADAAYHRSKVERGFGKLINIFGADHHGYIPRLQASVQAYSNSEKTLDVIIGQMVHVKKDGESAAMSKRAGTAVTLKSAIEESSADAIRFAMLSQGANQEIVFDIDEIKTKSMSNKMFYIQYAHARLSQLLENNRFVGEVVGEYRYDHPAELRLLSCLMWFDATVSSSASSYEPNRIVNYAYNLASLVHGFYQQCRVGGESEAVKNRRIILAEASKNVLKLCLSDLIGINAPALM